MKQVKIFLLALAASFIVNAQVSAQKPSFGIATSGGNDAEYQPVGESLQGPTHSEEGADYGDWKLTAKSLDDVGGWEQTVYSIGLGTDMALWDEQGCHSLDIYRRGGMKGLLSEEYLSSQDRLPGDSFKKALQARAKLLRDEVIQLRCAPDETLAPPMLLASGVDGFTLTNGFSTARIPSRVALANKMEGYRSEVRELSFKRTDLAAVDVDVMADTAAAIGTLVVMAYERDSAKPAAEPGQVLKSNLTPWRSGSDIVGKWKYDTSNQDWDKVTSGGSKFHLIESARITINTSDLDTGSNCNTKSKAYVRDLNNTVSGDHCGHVLAKRLGGNGALASIHNGMHHVNFFAQNGSINSGSYRVFEGKVYNAINFPNSCCGCDIKLEWAFSFSGTKTRPHWVDYQAIHPGPGSHLNACWVRFSSEFGTSLTFKIQGFSNPT